MIGWLAIAVGASSLWIAGRHNWGWLIGVAGTFLWLMYAATITHPGPVIASALIYGVVDLRNYWVGRKRGR